MAYSPNYFSIVNSLNDLNAKNRYKFFNQNQGSANPKKQPSFFTQAGNRVDSLSNNIINSMYYNNNGYDNYQRGLNYNNNQSYQTNQNQKINENKNSYQGHKTYSYNTTKINEMELTNIIGSKNGLFNLGNTCYMNACLQILFHSKYFIKQLLTKKNLLRQKKISKLFYDICEEIITPNNSANALKNFKYYFCQIHSQFKGSRHYDTQEFCRVLLEDISNELNEAESPKIYRELSIDGKSKIESDRLFEKFYLSTESSIVVDSFYAQIINIFSCKNGKNEKYSFEKILDLPLLFPSDVNSIKLEELLDIYFKDDQIDYCKKCKNCNKKKHYKRTKISRPPNILILSLQRINERNQTKNICKVEFDESLNIKKYIDEDCGHINEYKYNLYGIICHKGEINFGHYYSYIKLNGKEWYEFNDSKVSCYGDELFSKSTSVYVLFYEKNNI